MTFFAGCAGTATTDTESATDKSPKAPEKTISQDSSAQLAAPKAGDKIAVIETDFGTIKMKLFTEKVPEMTKNFEELAKEGKYNGVPFHRVVKNFMIQTGDFTQKNGTGGHSYKGPGTKLPDEISPNLKHLYSTVSMANSGPNTNGSQFFIVTNIDGATFLDGGYTIFGQVYEGMEVAEKIVDLQVPGTEKPKEEINMVKVEVMPFEG
jgi:peptidyl-prolyl cis-trans isomerase B (cyclophilin B)